MEYYKITVNGKTYDVQVEKKGEGFVKASDIVNVTPEKKLEQKASVSAPAAGSIIIAAGAAGKVWKIQAAVGSEVKKGDAVVIIEAMKMEIPMVAPEDGIIAEITCKEGDSVEAGTTLASMNPRS